MSSTRVTTGYRAPFTGGTGFEQLQVISEPQALRAVPDGARGAFIVAEGAAVRWRDDGANPDGTFGMPLPVNTVLEYTGKLKALLFLDATNVAFISVTYYS